MMIIKQIFSRWGCGVIAGCVIFVIGVLLIYEQFRDIRIVNRIVQIRPSHLWYHELTVNQTVQVKVEVEVQTPAMAVEVFFADYQDFQNWYEKIKSQQVHPSLSKPTIVWGTSQLEGKQSFLINLNPGRYCLVIIPNIERGEVITKVRYTMTVIR